MKFKLASMSLFLAAVTLAGCSGTSPEVKRILESPIAVESFTDPNSDFKQYLSWRWVPRPTSAVGSEEQEEINANIKDAVESELYTRGYRRTDDDRPDLAVNFHLATQEIDEDVIAKQYDGSYLPAYQMDIPDKAKKKRWSEGTLLVFVFDVETQQLVWRGGAQAEVAGSRDVVPKKDRTERLYRAVKLLMEEFPSRAR